MKILALFSISLLFFFVCIQQISASYSSSSSSSDSDQEPSFDASLRNERKQLLRQIFTEFDLVRREQRKLKFCLKGVVKIIQNGNTIHVYFAVSSFLF